MIKLRDNQYLFVMKFKKILLLFSAFFVLSCSDNEDLTSDLQAQITELESKITTLEGTISTLQNSLGSLTTSNASLASQLSAAEAALTEARNLVDTATTDISTLQSRLEFVQDALAGIDYSATVNLAATGSVADQTPAQAKATIYGRWNLSPSAASKLSAKLNGCSFDFIEFMDGSYLLGIYVAEYEETEIVFGEYILNEDTDGTVMSVDLMFDGGDVSISIATLTNIVVTETDDTLSASFDVELNLPEALEVCEASLPGSVVAPKEEPVEEAETSDALSNHAKLIGEWDVIDYSSSLYGGLDAVFADFCSDEDYETGEITQIDGCEAPVAIIVGISNFGTYSLSFINADGSIAEVEINTWAWNIDQTALYFGDQEYEGEELDAYRIIELTESMAKFSATYTDYIYDSSSDTETQVEVTETITLRKRM